MGMKNIYKLYFIESYYTYFVIAFVILFSLFFTAKHTYSQTVKIGIALSLFEESDDPSKKQLGTEILNGMKFALSEYGNSSPKVKYVIKDTKKDPSTAVSQITELIELDSVSCILGPIFSNELNAVSETALVNKIPVISPTATGDELAETHDYLFQLNPSYKLRGKLMADYLMKVKKMKNFVVISEDSYGINFRNSFENEVKILNGKILISATYGSKAANINDIVSSILNVIKDNDLFINVGNLNATQRKKLEDFGIRYSLVDSLSVSKTEVSIYYLFGRNAKKVADTMNIKPYPIKDINGKFIQGFIEAIYIPISNSNEISMIVPELYSNNLSFFIAGTGDWNNESTLEENKMYLKNLIFESEYYPDEGSSGYSNLKDELKKTKYKLNKNFLFGYDAAKLLLDIISGGNTTRSQIYDALNKIKSYEAIKSKISLDYNRVNSELNILTYDSGLKREDTYKISK
jgi:ABC-type branched-subunit amino acid transport system substrate-binding protein